MKQEWINLIWFGKKFTCEEDCYCHTECPAADKYLRENGLEFIIDKGESKDNNEG